MNMGFEPRESNSQVSHLNLYTPELPWTLNLVYQQLHFSLFFPQSTFKTFPIIYKECCCFYQQSVKYIYSFPFLAVF